MQAISDEGIDTRVWWALFAVIVAAFGVWTFGELRIATSARWQDTTGYLAHALYVAEHGGLLGFFREAYTGVFPIAERHPLNFLMLAPFAERTAEFFWNAKVLDLATGIAVLLSLIWMVNRRYGRGPALLAGVLYALSNSLVVAASHVNNETQFVLCALWAWWFLTEARDGTESGLAMPEEAGRWALAGAALGLAFMVKSPAILMGLAVVVAGVWFPRAKFVTTARVWTFLAVAALAASPLLVRNIVGHGTLFYESVNGHIMWLDDWTELGAEHSIIYYDTYGVTTVERNGLPTAADYFRTHSVGDVLQRLAAGAVDYFTRVIPTALGSPVLPVGGRLLGFAVFGVALVGWWLRRRTWDATFTFFWSGAFIGFFSWNTMFPEMRYIAPLVPVWIAFASFALWRIGTLLVSARNVWRVQLGGTAAVLLLALASTAASGKLTRPQPVLEASPSYLSFIDWLNTNAEPGDRIMIGETREFHGLIWMVEPRVNVLLNPNATTLEAFLRYLRERDVRYLLMHPEYLTGENREIAAALEPYFALEEDGAFVERKPLPGWRAVHGDPHEPPRFVLYEAVRDAAGH